ncbi:MAG: 2TM domain [Phormidesmis priestleyi Ana]|uniref:2TM domain n=1 Tax=Phormidesmis priestleyi Ana TaxID=1666911 RepID=A0A0P7Z2D8_9CYAN|nr:MAG: 2TM domain [Phormidesmis priestleyi Ana]
MIDLYASEEAQQILQIAIAKETEGGELTRTQLMEIAAELNIAPETLMSAEREWLDLKSTSTQQALFNQQRRQQFRHHLIRYGIVNGFLFSLNLLAGGVGIALFIALSWGIGLSLQGWRAYQSSGFRYQRDFESWQRRQQVKRSMNNLLSNLFNRFLNA